MASLEGTQLWWNGKLNSSADLLYYDKINVDVVHPPYATRDRNSSFFLKTRRGYAVDEFLMKGIHRDYGKQFDIVDVTILWDDVCEEKNGLIFYMGVSKQKDEKIILSRTIEDGVISEPYNQVYRSFQACDCVDEKFFKTSYVKGDARFIFDGEGATHSNTGIQINKVEGGAMRGYLSDESIEKGDAKFNWGGGISAGDYVVIFGSENGENDGYCGQVRTIIDYNEATGDLLLDSAWSGFKDGEDEVKGRNISYMIFPNRGEVVGFTSGKGVSVITDNVNTITLCDFGRPTGEANCIIASAATTDRVFLLYDNGWIHFGGYGRDKFYDSGDAMFCGEDKYNIACYRDFLLAMGSKKMAVAVADTTGQYYRMYNQSSTIGLKNKYAYGEYNGDFLICSNDNRLLALKVASSVGQYMLEYEDIGQYINPYLKAMLPGDKCYIGTDNNQLRVFINTISNIKYDDFNTRTLILKYDTIFGVWTCDKLGYSILRGVYEGFFFGDGIYTKKGQYDSVCVDEDDEPKIKKYTYNIGISAFLLENEENGQTQNNRSADLFSLAMLNKLIILLGMGRYDNSNTQLKITEYRNGYGYEQIISSLTSNDWLNNVGAAYEGTPIELSECILSDIKDGSNAIRNTCEAGHKIQEPIPLWEMFHYNGSEKIENVYAEHDYQLTDHRVCVNDEVYKMAPHMPLTIELGDQENYNSQIYVELVSNSDDVINFGGFLANLSLAPLGYKGADGEYLIEVESGC